MSEYIEVEIFERMNTNLRFVDKVGKDEYSLTVFQNLDDGKYYAKGPFGRLNDMYYKEMEDLTNDIQVKTWLKIMQDKNPGRLKD